MSVNVKRQMETSWNDKAVTNAYHWVDSTEDSWNKEAYYARGLSEADEYLYTPLIEYGVSPEAVSTMRVLDVGCGTGRLVRFFASKAKEVVGVDISEEMITTAKRDNQDLSNVDFRLGNGVDLSVCEDGDFDIVYSFIVFQHIPERTVIQKYISEMHRVLKPGGAVRFQVRGYPGRLRTGLPTWRYTGFDGGYLALDALKGIVPFLVYRPYDTVYGAFFKEKEIEKIIKNIGFKNVMTERDPENQRYLFVTATK